MGGKGGRRVGGGSGKWEIGIPRDMMNPRARDIVDFAQAAFETGAMAVDGVKAAAKAVKKWRNYRPPRWKLLACPDAEAVNRQWAGMKKRRGPLEALKFGAMLLNVSQYVDCSPIYGRGRHIVARNPGLKGWLGENCPGMNYITAMSYRKLAEVTCRAIGLPESIPLEWVLPGAEGLDAARDLNPDRKPGMQPGRRRLMEKMKECRMRLAKLLEGAKNVNQFNAALDAVTSGRRYRAPSKITAEGSLKRQLRTALYTLQSIPADETLLGRPEILLIVEDLRRQLQLRSA